MFGKPAWNNNSPQNNVDPLRSAKRRRMSRRSRAVGLVQVIVTALHPLTFFLFLNDTEVPQIDVDSLSIDVEMPWTVGRIPSSGRPSFVCDDLDREQDTATFGTLPCTIEVIALGRRLAITCMNLNSLEGLWVTLGLKRDGTDSDLSGLQSVRFLLNQDLLDAKITWEDGESEDLLPQ